MSSSSREEAGACSYDPDEAGTSDDGAVGGVPSDSHSYVPKPEKSGSYNLHTASDQLISSLAVKKPHITKAQMKGSLCAHFVMRM